MMGSVCGEQHKLRHLFLNNKGLVRDVIDIPPRKLLRRRPVATPIGEVLGDSPRADEEALLRKFLPRNNGGDDDGGGDYDDDPYSSDHFRMYEFKVRRCTRSRSHDWTDCPFAHPGEKARRRDPRRYHYSGTVCSEFRRGTCSRGDNCEFAHGVFECWLHPARYRTEACKDGKNCKRKVCFFAHSARQLRVLPPSSASPPANSPSAGRKYSNSNHCCLFCHNVTASPTSTLLGMSHLSPPLSPSLSPPLSPVKGRSLSGLSPVSRYGESCGLTQFNPSPLSYKDVLTELMSSLDAMNLHEASPPGNKNLPWIDVSFSQGDGQNLFILSPSTPSPSVSRKFFSEGDCSSRTFNTDDKLNDNGASAGPDLGWVNDLLT